MQLSQCWFKFLDSDFKQFILAIFKHRTIWGERSLLLVINQILLRQAYSDTLYKAHAGSSTKMISVDSETMLKIKGL